MTLLIVAGHALSLVGFRLPLLLALQAAGHHVHATAPEDDAAVTAKLATYGIPYHSVPMSRAGLNLLADLKYRRNLRHLMRRLGVEGVLAYTHKPVIHALSAARAAGVRNRIAMITGLGYAFTPGGGLRRRLARAVITFLYRRAMPSATAIFFQNLDDLGCFEALGLLRGSAKPRVVAGSGIPLDEFPPREIPSSPPVFLMMARLIADKGVREYAAAAAVVKSSMPGARCLLAGEFDANPTSVKKEELESWVRSGAIEYLGHLGDVRPALAASTIYVLPSYREGTPRSVLEALATARPVITTDAPGCRETVVSPGLAMPDGRRPCANGWLVPVADTTALAAAMMDLASRSGDWTVMANCSRRYAEDKYDVRKVNADILSAFTS